MIDYPITDGGLNSEMVNIHVKVLLREICNCVDMTYIVLSINNCSILE
jgi:hypothetical protein